MNHGTRDWNACSERVSAFDVTSRKEKGEYRNLAATWRPKRHGDEKIEEVCRY